MRSIIKQQDKEAMLFVINKFFFPTVDVILLVLSDVQKVEFAIHSNRREEWPDIRWIGQFWSYSTLCRHLRITHNFCILGCLFCADLLALAGYNSNYCNYLLHYYIM